MELRFFCKRPPIFGQKRPLLKHLICKLLMASDFRSAISGRSSQVTMENRVNREICEICEKPGPFAWLAWFAVQRSLEMLVSNLKAACAPPNVSRLAAGRLRNRQARDACPRMFSPGRGSFAGFCGRRRRRFRPVRGAGGRGRCRPSPKPSAPLRPGWRGSGAIPPRRPPTRAVPGIHAISSRGCNRPPVR